MFLVDTSVLIGYFKGFTGEAYTKLDEIIDHNIPFGINDFIYQEVLQGAKNEKEFSQLKEYLGTLLFYPLHYGCQSYEKAAYLYFLCRKAGITVRSTIDLIIAETAIENDLFLLHNDSDYENMSKIVKELKLYNK